MSKDLLDLKTVSKLPKISCEGEGFPIKCESDSKCKSEAVPPTVLFSPFYIINGVYEVKKLSHV